MCLGFVLFSVYNHFLLSIKTPLSGNYHLITGISLNDIEF